MAGTHSQGKLSDVQFGFALLSAYNRDGVARLLDLNEELLQATERVVRLYEEQ